MYLLKLSSAILISILVSSVLTADDDYNILNKDGSFEFGYNNPDSFHHSKGNRNNVVFGEFGGRNPGTGGIDKTTYTAGPRGYRPVGKNVARKYDLSQSGPRPIGSPDDPYFDPNEDPSYKFAFNTRTYNRQEAANRIGDVNGKYTYWDDIGERHDVQYIAGKDTGFHVLTPYPDSKPFPYRYFNGRGKPLPRGRTAISRKTDGSYSFVSVGPDQRRTETSDAAGNVRGSYTYLDEKGVQHSVHYIAGPQIGYRVLKKVKEPHLPNVFPFERPGTTSDSFNAPEDEYNKDLFVPAASGHVKPSTENKFTRPTTSRPSRPGPIITTQKPIITDLDQFIDSDDNEDGFDEIFGTDSLPNRPVKPTVQVVADLDDGSYKPSGDDGSYIPDNYDEVGSGFSSRPSDSNYKPYGTKPTGSSLKPSGSVPRPTNLKPALQLGVPSVSGASYGLSGTSPPDYYSHTIVTNVGDTLFTVPPGVSVRAHVQAIDLLPLGTRSPSPSEQYKADTERVSEQVNAESSNVSELVNHRPDTATTEKSHVNTLTNSTSIQPGTTTGTTPEPKKTTTV